ncbi:hypothetical protein KQX54_017629 [Cotesia glomerata]|uniref:C2H2-type domain-containing protein n=1 Tax=Cotesia glomerata TaxID=32391 RepID=A0AAV7IYV5_COTGL|nr:hypothetical protein KQX54_017629 [Cotesia glomerata]
MNGGHQFLQESEIREKKKYNTRYQASTVKKKNFGLMNLKPEVLLHRIAMPEPEPPAAAIESFEKIFNRTKIESIRDLLIDLEENRRKPTKIRWENNYYVCNICSCKFGSRSEVESHTHRHL